MQKKQTYLQETISAFGRAQCEQVWRAVSNKGEEALPRVRKDQSNKEGTGNGQIEWKYFDKLDTILAARPATHSPILLETLKPIESDRYVTNVEGVHEQSDGIEDSKSGTASLSGTPLSHHSDGSVKGIDAEDNVKNRAGIKGKKRKRSKGELLEDAMTKAMKIMTDGLGDSDKMFIDLEEKRMKFEENQRSEECEFKLQMVQMFQGRLGGNSYYPSYSEPYGHSSSAPLARSGAMYYGPPDDDY